MKKIGKEEKLITGKWLYKDNIIVADENCNRINELIKTYLIKIDSDPSGWYTLYRDPSDNRMWELSYLQSDVHGGGPPQLSYLTLEEVKNKYNI